MTEALVQLRELAPDAFRRYLREYLHNGLPAVVAFPPNERPALAFARLVSRDKTLCALVLSTLPELIAELSTTYADDVIERAMLLYGYCRAAAATPIVVALCDELDRRNRNIALCISALAAQLPVDEKLLELLLRKGKRPELTPTCLRALLRLDRPRAARLLAQVPQQAVNEDFLQSALTALSADELLEAIRELYNARPGLEKAMLKRIESVTGLVVVRGDDSDFTIHIKNTALRVSASDRTATAAWFSAADRTSKLGVTLRTSLPWHTSD